MMLLTTSVQRHMYSFLTTHEITFFIKCIGDRVYAVTDGFHCTTLNPSVPEMVYCEWHDAFVMP
jgi:ABC-type polar amino acid transport system ATPase subunit